MLMSKKRPKVDTALPRHSIASYLIRSSESQSGIIGRRKTVVDEREDNDCLHAAYCDTPASRLSAHGTAGRVVADHSWAQIQLPMSSERSWIAGDALTMSSPAKGSLVDLPAMSPDLFPLDRRRTWYEPRRNTGYEVKESSSALDLEISH